MPCLYNAPIMIPFNVDLSFQSEEEAVAEAEARARLKTAGKDEEKDHEDKTKKGKKGQDTDKDKDTSNEDDDNYYYDDDISKLDAEADAITRIPGVRVKEAVLAYDAIMFSEQLQKAMQEGGVEHGNKATGGLDPRSSPLEFLRHLFQAAKPTVRNEQGSGTEKVKADGDDQMSSDTQ